jgi:ABC-type transport system involved in multi-copper enzyme maturation permease subunit
MDVSRLLGEYRQWGSGLKWALVLVVAVALIPPITWLAIGAGNIGDPCSEKDPDLSTWLLVTGSVELVQIVLFITGMLLFTCISSTRCLAGVGVSIVVYLILAMFQITWYIVGAIRLSQDETCKHTTPAQYNATLAAVILGFTGILAGMAMRQVLP